MSVNGAAVAEAHSVDGEGRSLPECQGCMSLNEGRVFLPGDTAGSCDGRYFGVTRASKIISRADPLLAF